MRRRACICVMLDNIDEAPSVWGSLFNHWTWRGLMDVKDHESFVRWQGVTRDHFSSVSNLVLGLSTGLLAFIVSNITSIQALSPCLLVLMGASTIFLAVSINMAVWCAINRLRDFRATTKIARARWKGDGVNPADRHDSKIVGDRSWLLFWWQLVLFACGAIAVALVVAFQLSAPR